MGKKKFKIIADRSNIDWTGRKITGPHNGVVAIKEGTLVLNEGKKRSLNFKQAISEANWMTCP